MDIVELLKRDPCSDKDHCYQSEQFCQCAIQHKAADVIEQLRADVDRMASLAIDNTRDMLRLREKYKEAIDDIEEWGAYAPEYFQEKWKLKECIEQHRAALKEGE